VTLLVQDKSVRELNEGEFVSTGYRFTGVSSNGGGVGVLLVNNSDYDVLVSSIVVRSGFKGRVEKGFNPSVDSQGESLNFTNKKSGLTGSSSGGMSAYRFGEGSSGSLTFDGSNFNPKHLAAGTATSPGTEAEVGGNILAVGDSMFVYALNESSNSGDVSIDVDFVKLNNL